ncbi:tetratricopeptide repeat protein [Flavobacterium sp. WW92]|uniref:SH3 domain-containing protein n=1 Tax=unclassified Flavobacterium TaxID=196869 RepID=UPI002225A5B5|nr:MULTISPECIES: tetratricopeptide repeat protein [unclassified Flavobacterium]WDO13723.1 tetratricopeptide repeat protein [Flavobacterium sp. WW92]
MKNVFYILLLFTQIFWAQDNFEAGNKLYRQDKFEEAVKAYENVLKTKKHSAELYFNLGNAYYKLNKTAPAIYNYEKALLLNPGYSEAKNNLQFAQNMTIDEIKPVQEVGFGKVIHDFTSSHTYDGWAKIAIGFSVIFLLFFIGYYFSAATMLKRIFFVGLFIALIGLIISVASAIAEKTRYENDKPAIIFADTISVKNEPKENADDAFILHEGTKVQVIEVLDNWRKIQLADEKEGWISKEALKEIK